MTYEQVAAVLRARIGPVGDAWLAAHARLGRLDEFHAELAAARRAVQAQTDAALAAGRPAPSFALELRYGLLAGDAAAIARRTVGPGLAALLLDAGLWTAGRAWRDAIATAQPAERGRAMCALLSRMPAPDRPDALAATIAATADVWADTRVQDSTRAESLVVLLPHLTADSCPDVLERVLAVDAEYTCGELLTLLVPALPDALLGRVLAALGEFEFGVFVREPLGAVLARLPAGLVPSAWRAVDKVDDGPARAELLLALSPHLPPGERPPLVAEALSLYRAVEYPAGRARCLASVAPHLPPAEREVVFAEAVAVARTEEFAASRAYVLAELGQHAEAVATAAGIEHGYTQAQVLSQLLRDLPATLVPQVLAAARELAPDNRATVYTALAPRLPADDARPLLAEALATRLTGIDHESYFSIELSVLAPHLPDDLLARAVAEVRDLGRAGYLGRVLTYNAEHLSGVALDTALAAARGLTRSDHRARSLAALAKRLPEPSPVLAEALAAARSGGHLGALWTQLADAMPPALRREYAAEELRSQYVVDWDRDGARAVVERYRRYRPRFGFVPRRTDSRIGDDLLRCQRAWRAGLSAQATVARLRAAIDASGRADLDITGEVFAAAAAEFGGAGAAEEYLAAIEESYDW